MFRSVFGMVRFGSDPLGSVLLCYVIFLLFGLNVAAVIVNALSIRFKLIFFEMQLLDVVPLVTLILLRYTHACF